MKPTLSTREVVREMEQLHSAADLLRGHPDYAAPGKATEVIRGLLDRLAAAASAGELTARRLPALQDPLEDAELLLHPALPRTKRFIGSLHPDAGSDGVNEEVVANRQHLRRQ